MAKGKEPLSPYDLDKTHCPLFLMNATRRTMTHSLEYLLLFYPSPSLFFLRQSSLITILPLATAWIKLSSQLFSAFCFDTTNIINEFGWPWLMMIFETLDILQYFRIYTYMRTHTYISFKLHMLVLEHKKESEK